MRRVDQRRISFPGLIDLSNSFIGRSGVCRSVHIPPQFAGRRTIGQGSQISDLTSRIGIKRNIRTSRSGARVRKRNDVEIVVVNHATAKVPVDIGHIPVPGSRAANQSNLRHNAGIAWICVGELDVSTRGIRNSVKVIRCPYVGIGDLIAKRVDYLCEVEIVRSVGLVVKVLILRLVVRNLESARNGDDIISGTWFAIPCTCTLISFPRFHTTVGYVTIKTVVLE